MAFSSVQVDILDESIKTIESALKTGILDEVLKNFSNQQYFQTRAVNPPKKALEILKNTRYKELENMLVICMDVKNLIVSYKTKEQSIANYKILISNEQAKEKPSGSKIRTYRKRIEILSKEMDNIVKCVNEKI